VKRATTMAVAVAVSLVLASGVLEAGLISATGAAEKVTAGDYAGWYKYTYEVTWSQFDYGLSHLDIVLKEGCAAADHLYVFDVADLGLTEDGHSTGEDWHSGDAVIFTVSYKGEFQAISDPGWPGGSLPGPLVKWDAIEDGDEPGKQGVGEFWFYANILPEDGTFDDVLAAKYGQDKVFGDLDGAYPSCQIIPEPATLVLMAVGGVATFLARRRRK